MKMRLILLSLFVISFFEVVHAENAMEIKWNLSANPARVDIGPMLQGQTRRIDIILKNEAITGNQEISEVRASCNCLTPRISKSTITPRETAVLSFIVVAGNLKRDLKEEVIIEYSNTKSRNLQFLRLPITASIDTIAEILPRNIATSGSLEDLAAWKTAINVKKGSIDHKWDFLKASAIPENLVTSEIKQLSSSEFEILLALNIKDLNYGLHEGKLIIKCFNSANEAVFLESLPISVSCISPIEVIPHSIYISDAAKDNLKKIDFEIVSEKTEIKCQDISIISSNPQQIKIYRPTLTSDKKAAFSADVIPVNTGLFDEFITIVFKGKYAGSIKVPITGIVMEKK